MIKWDKCENSWNMVGVHWLLNEWMGVWLYNEEMEDPNLSSMPREGWVMGPGVLNSKEDALSTLPLSCEEEHLLELSICYKWDLMVILYGWHLSASGWGNKDQEVQYQGLLEKAEDSCTGYDLLACDGGLGVGKGIWRGLWWAGLWGCEQLSCGSFRQVALGFCINVRGSEDLPMIEP